MKKRIAILSVLVLLATSGCGDKNTVDGKARISVPATPSPVTCLLLEIDRESSSGGSISENYVCVGPEEYDRNKVGEEWVDSKGKKK